MVEELAESPGMRSDRPGTTPKCPFLGDPFHVLEKERESLRDVPNNARRPSPTRDPNGRTVHWVGADRPRGPSHFPFSFF